MENYDEMISVKDYIKDLKENGYNKGPLMSAEDYATTLREQCVKYQSKSLMTVEDYIKSLDNGGRYMTPIESDIENQVTNSLKSKKAELNARIVEDLLSE